MNLDEMIQKFTDIFDADCLPEAFFAPGRVNLIGEHTDYNGGHVFPCALDVGYSIDKGMDLYIYGNIPNGSGLSSSASLEVLTGIILKNCFHFDSLALPQIALLGQAAENKYNGMNCGIMDQFASAMGKKNHAIFRWILNGYR